MFLQNSPAPDEPTEAAPCIACGQPGGVYTGWHPKLCLDCYFACGDSEEMAAARRALEPFPCWQVARATGLSPLPLDPETAAAVRAWVPPTLEQSIAACRRAAEAWLLKRRRVAA